MVQIEVNEELIKKVAKNARLNLTKSELEEFVPQLKEVILNSFNKLDKLDVSGTKPSFQPIELSNKFRRDEVVEGLSQVEALLNVSEKLKEKGYFKGPKVI